MNKNLEKFNEIVDSFKNYIDNWNSYGAKPISDKLAKDSKSILEKLIENDLIPSGLYPTDESIIFEFKINSNRNILELYEDDDVVLVLKDDIDKYYDFNLTDIITAIEILKNHIELRIKRNK